jgi:hypothetical protein
MLCFVDILQNVQYVQAQAKQCETLRGHSEFFSALPPSLETRSLEAKAGRRSPCLQWTTARRGLRPNDGGALGEGDVANWISVSRAPIAFLATGARSLTCRGEEEAGATTAGRQGRPRRRELGTESTDDSCDEEVASAGRLGRPGRR